MGRPDKLSEAEVAAKLAQLPGWSLTAGKLTRTFQFADFATAMAFMVAVAIHADRLDHHPNWSNVYNRVEVTLWTHDVGGLTGLDFALAAKMNAHAG